MKLAELARHARAELAGEGELEIEAVTELAQAHPRALVLVADPRRLPEAEASPAGALLVGTQVPHTRKPALRARNPRAAFARVLAVLAPPRRPAPGIHPTAVVASDTEVHPEATVEPHAVLAGGVVVGARSVIGAGTVIGARTRIGVECVLHPLVTVYADCALGDRVIVHSGAVIGSDGFGYATEDGVHLKIPHLGRVVIEDDVEIGANATIDRATLGETRIGRGSKIDNLVQIAHNVVLGPGTIIAALTGISGSVTIGEGAVLAGQVGVRDHVTIGAGATVLGRAGVTKDVAPGLVVSGFPARPHRDELRIEAAGALLPEALERLRALEARVDALDRRRRE
ncbi:MAG: UDP-3-O-(3-hydroxymyristoyl)glucosamine N-acyltransferase [Armatimonadota bacterium]|nr:UDP-3-O-(3-hydroxymyristoyl)glucosamine N-acyltransferase [Armatimonadota bacterium]